MIELVIQPVLYAIDGAEIKFAYDQREFDAFMEEGRTRGTGGYILDTINTVSRELTFKGFGTSEGPCCNLQYFTIRHAPQVDGPWKEPVQWLKTPVIDLSTAIEPDIWSTFHEVY